LKKVSPEFISYIGIGAFTILWIFELSVILDLIAENILIITKTKSLSASWLSELIGVFFFIVILTWVLNYFRKLTELNTRKTLIKSIVIFFGMMLLQFSFSFLVSGFLNVQFSDAYNLYYDGLKGNYSQRAYLSLIPISKYVILALVFFVERKTIANNTCN